MISVISIGYAYTHNIVHIHQLSFFFFFNDTATTEIYTLSLHDALPIYDGQGALHRAVWCPALHHRLGSIRWFDAAASSHRSEEHTSELQSLAYLVCRLLLEKKKKITHHTAHSTSQCTSQYLTAQSYTYS